MSFSSFCIGLLIVYALYYITVMVLDYLKSKEIAINSKSADVYQVTETTEEVIIDEPVPISAAAILEKEQALRKKEQETVRQRRIKEEAERIRATEISASSSPAINETQTAPQSVPQNKVENTAKQDLTDELISSNQNNKGTQSEEITNVTHFGGISMKEIRSKMSTTNLLTEIAAKY